MKLGTGVLYKKLSSKHECRENQRSNSHALPKGVNEILPTFSTLFT
jgi:hypothetical protein